ncbi:MAG: cupin domain-containing protein [Acidimicrobiia bacterium]
MEAVEVINRLGLRPLPREGGMFRQYYADANSTAIYFLVTPGDYSALHRLTTPEIYHFYVGAPLAVLLLHPDGRVDRAILGPDLAAGQVPSLVVVAGVWQGSATTGDWSLVGTTMAPGFRPEMFELGDQADLVERYPEAVAEIARLTRPPAF